MCACLCEQVVSMHNKWLELTIKLFQNFLFLTLTDPFTKYDFVVSQNVAVYNNNNSFG